MASSSASQSTWPQYGAVPLKMCPDCPRPEPLKRFVSKTDENGNLGRHFVRCASKPMVGGDGKMLKKCGHFEWLDEYVARLEIEGCIERNTATRELAVENFSSDDGHRAVPTAPNAPSAELPASSEVNKELKKINKYLRQMIDLQRQANIMAGGFYASFIALFIFYLLFISR